MPQEQQPPESTELVKTESQAQAEQPSFWGSVFGAVGGAASAVGGAAASAGGAIAGGVTGAAGVVGSTAVQAGGVIAGGVTGAAGVVGSTAVQAGGAIVGTTISAGSAVGGAAVYAGGAITSTAVGAGGAVANAAMQLPSGLGWALDMVNQSPQLRELTKAVNLDQFVSIIQAVDVVKAESHVRHLQKVNPNEKPAEIAHRLMMEKALYVGGSGFATSFLPGFAAAMFAVDLLATTALQAEMVYQIACAYGFDLQSTDRKGEVLTLFGLAFGGNYALEAGLAFTRNIPVAGAVIAASSNAAMLYTLGYAACRFYEAKLSPATSQEVLEVTRAESEEYLQEAHTQEAIMDQILVHVILAGNPGKTCEQILSELQTLNLSSTSSKAISATIKSPPSLESLLNRINDDFAVALTAQCEQIAQLDGVITSEEAKVINTIKQRFGNQLASLNAA